MKVLLLLFVTVFIGVKTVTAQKRMRKDTINSLNIRDSGPKDHKDGIGEDTYTKYKPPANEPYSFAEVEILPAFPGGEEASKAYFRRKIKTTPLANNSRVIVSFIVEKNGALTDIKVLRGLNIEADKKALKVLKKSPKWTPGQLANKIVRVAYTMPINFYN